MKIITKTFKNLDEIKAHLRTHLPTIYLGSRTSTVIPFDRLESALACEGLDELYIGDLSVLPKNQEITDDGYLKFSGPVTWLDAKQFCLSKGRDILTSPTEELAAGLSGIATSCTGERCFGYGTLREQVKRVRYLDFGGNEHDIFSNDLLENDNLFKENVDKLKNYQSDYLKYINFKNAPYPRMSSRSDLMIGTEGQLGVVIEAEIKTVSHEEISYIFILLPKWEENFDSHLELFKAVQNHRDKIYSCELLDDNSLNVLPKEDRPGKSGEDLIFLEIKSKDFEFVFEEVLSNIDSIDLDKIYEISQGKCHDLRMSVPRATFEENSKAGVVKKGTDVQVSPKYFPALIDFYRNCTKGEVKYNLFGHFGDAHLHFNFLPTQDQINICDDYLENLYKEVETWEGSPFAEHGIGVIKKKFINKYYGPHQYELFKFLKEKMDPYNQFFPMGFMGMKNL